MVTVVCTGGDEPPSSLSLSWLNASHRIVAADGGLATLRRLGRRADLWVGDGDSLEGGPQAWASWYREAVVLDRAKDETDTEAAVRVALETSATDTGAADAGPTEVWLLGGSGQRMDHWWANLRLVASTPQITRWLTAYEQARSVSSGTLVLEAGTVSVFPLGPGPWSLTSEGLRWPVDGVDFSRWHSLSNEAAPGARLSVVRGQFLVLQPLEGERA